MLIAEYRRKLEKRDIVMDETMGGTRPPVQCNATLSTRNEDGVGRWKRTHTDHDPSAEGETWIGIGRTKGGRASVNRPHRATAGGRHGMQGVGE